MIEQNALDMEVIVNPKALDGGVNVYQLETAVGAAMKCFENGMGIKVVSQLTNCVLGTERTLLTQCFLSILRFPDPDSCR